MALRVIKNDTPDNENKSSSKGIYIIQVKNQKGEIGYVGKHLGKIFVFGELCSEVEKYSSAAEAKEIAKKISNVQVEIIGRHKIEKILAKQKNIDVTVPIEDIKEKLYCVSVIDINTNEKIGYIGYKPELKQYYLKNSKEGIAFWEGEETTNNFMESAKGLISNHKNLKLEKELLNDNKND